MRVLELLEQPWAIRQEVLDRWINLLSRRAAGEGKQGAFINLATGESQPLGYELRGGTAVIRVDGTLVKRLFAFDCGVSTEQVRAAVEAAMQDASVRSVLLDINSPGGTVEGTQALAAYLRQAGELKPIHAFCDGTMTSAAYWVAAACSRVAVQETAVVGSIGVLCVHTDVSAQDAEEGIKRTYLHAGRDKALGNDAEPLSDRARAAFQTLLDGTYAAFLADVAAFRSLDLEKAGEWADGKRFKAKDALAVGLVDEITTLDDFIGRIQQEDGFMNKPLVDQSGQSGQAQANAVEQAAAQDVNAAVAAETQRMVTLAGAVFGQEAGDKLGKLAASGVTAEQMAAAAEVFGQSSRADQVQAAALPAAGTKEKILDALHAASPSPVAPAQQAPTANDVHTLAKKIAGVSN